MERNLQINYYGYFTPVGGYGIANLNWIKHLSRCGIDVYPHAKFKPKEGSIEWEMLDDEQREILNKPFEKKKIGIIESNPFDFDILDTDIKIANTMCESDHVDSSWAEALNKMDYIIVPNKFNKDVFINSGVTKPIKIIPHGVDTDTFYNFSRPGNRDVFTFGILGYLDQHDRKGAFDTIRAFVSEFKPGEPVRLLIKSSDPSFKYYSRFTDPRIEVITKPYLPHEVYQFYGKLDCFVFPSKAEGIGYPPREAMLTGLPVILTQWSGMKEVAFKDISYPLTHFTLKKRYNFIEQDGNWAVNDIQEIMYWMRYAYEHREESKFRGHNAAKYIRDKFNWTKSAIKMRNFLHTL